jgi:hypothetical protein
MPATYTGVQYCDASDVKAALAIGTADTTDDTLIAEVIAAASRAIDDYTGQFFYQIADGTAFFTASDYVQVDTHAIPIISVHALTTDGDGSGTYETSWTNADFNLLPATNTLTNGSAAKPYTQIAATPSGSYAFPAGLAKGVRVVGHFGWAAVPSAVKLATIAQSAMLFEGRRAPFGVIGSTDQGTVMRMSARMHPEAVMLLEGYRTHLGVGV